jgi:hypothetical protein
VNNPPPTKPPVVSKPPPVAVKPPVVKPHPQPNPRPVPAPRPGAQPVGVVPNRPVQQLPPPRVVPHQRPSQLDNPRTQVNLNRARVRQDYVRRIPRYLAAVNARSLYYRQYRRPRILTLWPHFRGYYGNPYYRYFYSRWFYRGFYGGYWYPVRPCWDIDYYYYYPVIYWMFVNNTDQYYNDYYSDWYGSDYSTSQPIDPFIYAGVFYPTETLRDLGQEVSSMSYTAQQNFRAGLTQMTNVIQQKISENLVAEFQFDENDIVVNHYQNLQDTAIELDGFVDH